MTLEPAGNLTSVLKGKKKKMKKTNNNNKEKKEKGMKTIKAVHFLNKNQFVKSRLRFLSSRNVYMYKC